MIKKWNNFDESVSGWEIVGKDMNYSPESTPQTIDTSGTQPILGMDGNLYFQEDFEQLLQKVKLRNIPRDFNKKNLDILLFTLK
jgi:hypothetical protein